MPLFAVSLSTPRDLLVFFFLSRVALIPAQLTGFFCAKDSTFPFSRVRQDSCQEIVDSHGVSMDRGKQHLNHTHLERLWTVLQPLAKPAIVFCLCKRVWGLWILRKILRWLNFRIPDYRSVQSKEVELFFILELNWDYGLNIILISEDDNTANLILLYVGIWAWNWNMDSVPVGANTQTIRGTQKSRHCS